ncbi:unnamed protein product [Symbiodinium pilosum]|uniref:Uncharacterized protein n=1 Tax=Symbiodinium pilosum TaxID=2952 RepID=A0A812Y4S3_SYMPI|nr:unnamed protein product [Symbiodinium pilosum]
MRGLSEQRAVVYPCVRERYEAAKKCGFSDEQNPYHESKYEALTAPVCSMDFDRVTGFSLDALTGERASAPEFDWGDGPEIPTEIHWAEPPLLTKPAAAVAVAQQAKESTPAAADPAPENQDRAADSRQLAVLPGQPEAHYGEEAEKPVEQKRPPALTDLTDEEETAKAQKDAAKSGCCTLL